MLLWVCLLQTWTLCAGMWSRTLSALTRVRLLSVLGGLSAGFLLFILGSSNPFVRVFQDLATTGRDLNPLLQDPGFLFHPPMLYMGYVGSAVSFAFAIVVLWSGEWDEALVKWVRPWVAAAWCCLTLGVTLGSWWAYRELGWGGYWFWDPVENASFMPWLVGTALLHVLIVAQKRRLFFGWALLLSIIAFSLSLIGTFLVRSGVLTSVHAFAVDPTRGLFILVMLGVVVGGSLLLFAVRPQVWQQQAIAPLLSRETLLLGNNVLLVVGMLTILLGTTYPLMIEALGLGKLSVGAPYFNTVWVPLMMPLLALMGFACTVKWGPNNWRDVSRGSWAALAVSIVISLGAFGFQARQWESVLGIGLGVWVLSTTLQGIWVRRQRDGAWCWRATVWGWRIAHLGVAFSVLGVAISAGFGLQQDGVFTLQHPLTFAGYQVTLTDLSKLTGPNYHGVRAHVLVKGWVTQGNVLPEKRIYDVGHQVMTDAAIDVTPLRDVYVALGEPVSATAWTVRLYYKPCIRWIWFGGVLMFLGGLLSVFGHVRKPKINGVRVD